VVVLKQVEQPEVLEAEEVITAVLHLPAGQGIRH
jgi:hypothetical protein